MIYPLSWLEEYVKLPKSFDELTNRLTIIGHMLDKKQVIGQETLIDLELRGNRSDLLGVYGLAREISAAWQTPLEPLETKDLGKQNLKSEIVVVKNPELVERFMAIPLNVKVKGSPLWLKKRLSYFGIPSINNVVDITNYVMLETGEPMHAFDLDRLTGKKLILRRARNGEILTTIAGNKLELTIDDLVISDLSKPQGSGLIGSRDSGTTESTNQIILEAAVYKYANIRHTARRLALHTDAGTRHEKILDPNQVKVAMARAYKLLVELAEATPIDDYFDFYPQKANDKKIKLKVSDTERLGGVKISASQASDILKNLGCNVEKDEEELVVCVPTFRTDIDQSADLIEEIVRIYGYDKIPSKSLSDILPTSDQFPKVKFKEQVQDVMVKLGFNEIISPTFVENRLYGHESTIKVTNPVDVNYSILRPNLIINLCQAAKKAGNFKKVYQSFFEIGRVFLLENKKEVETDHLGFIKKTAGDITQKDFDNHSAALRVILDELGLVFSCESADEYPIFSKTGQGKVIVGDTIIGRFGYIGKDYFACELDLDKIFALTKPAESPYSLYPLYPAIYEDITLEVNQKTKLGDFVQAVLKLSPIIRDVRRIDSFNRNVTLRITYQDDTKSLSNQDIKPLKDKIDLISKKLIFR